jgi:hypothetical protein
MTLLSTLEARPHSNIPGEVSDSRVSLAGAWEPDYWTHKFGVSAGELMRIIGKVGNSVAAVRKELGLAAVPPVKNRAEIRLTSGSTSISPTRLATNLAEKTRTSL